MFYQKHLFFCINQRPEGKACCNSYHSTEMAQYAKQQIALAGLAGKGKIRVSTSGCLGRCLEGPVLVIYPDAIWYTYQDRTDIDEILKQHIGQNQLVERLLLAHP